ncbi:polysaccharide pyruvyl transferase family protein [Vibrio cyclitrophicus]|uniref:polysaccharide pyruvyl transferase family protein n=1 Tax=Vibrio cyclitrophicus TaxID=47951 RepID=UPI000C8372BD|nr:polysaccharide pyruvyl transferase family protein [Vibrio cyclitrophicus]PMF46521.1 hypothetical protein BCV14_15285 [Vibrio cyclitrophicus]
MKEVNICLLWHNLNSSNYGVGALAISQINLINDVCIELGVKPKFTTFGTKSLTTLNIESNISKEFGLSIKHKNFHLKKEIINFLKLKFNLHKEFKNYDLIIDVGEGDSFTDIYGSKRFTNMMLTKIISLVSGKPLILAPQTIGPFKNKLYEKMAMSVIRRAEHVFSRDYKTSAMLKNNSVEYIQVSDLAFSLPYEKCDVKDGSVGINVSGLLWNGGYSQSNQFNLGLNYKNEIIKLINIFINNGNQVHLISHVIDDNMLIEDDYRACVEIANIIKNENIIIGPKFSSPIEAKSYISSMEFFAGSRMHATIAAVSSGVPCVPLAYSRKFSGVFETINYNCTIDLHDGISSEFSEKVFSIYQNEIKKLRIDSLNAKNKSIDLTMEYRKVLHEKIKNVTS